MLLKPDKSVNLTTSYRPISLISSIMKLFKRVIEHRLRSHLEDIGFINKHQSGFRRAKSSDDHLFRLSQSIMESFHSEEHVVAAFLDVEKAFDNVWHNGLRYKIFQLGLPTKMTRWLSDFLVGRLIQVNVNSFLSQREQLNPEKTKVIIFSRSLLARKAELDLTLYGEPLKIYPQVKFLGIIFDSKLTFQKPLRTS